LQSSTVGKFTMYGRGKRQTETYRTTT